jgi:hypothetical protein
MLASKLDITVVWDYKTQWYAFGPPVRTDLLEHGPFRQVRPCHGHTSPASHLHA